MTSYLAVSAIAAAITIFPSFAIAQSPSLDQPPTDGRLSIVWGDPDPTFNPRPGDAQIAVLISDEATGESTQVVVSKDLMESMSGFLSWDGHRVRVFWGDPDARELSEEQRLSLEVPGRRLAKALKLLPETDPERARRGGLVSGSQPWISILCKFSDKPSEPENLAFFQGMYDNSPGRLDHYWREVSANTIDIVGSTAIDWVTLPGTQASYVPTPGSGTDSNLNGLFDDCTAAADPFVDFSNGGTPYEGINQMFNDLLDCCAWGGGRFATLDGVSKSWRVTWEPPWAYASVGVIAHEMGHGFGLPHSNNWDNDGNPYDSPWDVMSSATGRSVVDPIYGRRGMHTISYHKNRLGWIPAAEKITIDPGQTETFDLDRLALTSTSNRRMALVPIPDSSRFYTVETRDPVGDYDGALPGRAVIIHEISEGRPQPAWAYDADVPPAGYGDNEGTMWRVGETFEDSVNEISISINAATTDGFSVTISSGPIGLLFADSFETGDTTMWPP